MNATWRVALALAVLCIAGLIAASASTVQGEHDNRIALQTVIGQPLATIGLRQSLPAHPGLGNGETSSTASPACDKDIDATSSIAGVSFVAAQDNSICTNTDIDSYENGGQVYVVQAGGQEAAFTITRIAADGTPTLVTQTAWVQTNTYTPDVKAFKQGTKRYIALALERLEVGNSSCGVMIVEVTDAPATTVVDQVIGAHWCDVHNVFVESDASGDGRYVYLTADFPNDMRVLDIGDLSNISEIGRYTHPEASGNNYVHDITVVDHGGTVGRRVYVSYWAAGLTILNASDVTPGVVESGSPNQPLNPDHSIDPSGFLMHHAYPNENGTRVFIQDEFLSSSGEEPVQMWDIGSPTTPAYLDGIRLDSSLMPMVNPAHNLFVDGDRLYVGWYKAGLQAFDFDGSTFTGRPMYHQIQTEPSDDSYSGAWGVRLASSGDNTFIFQSDRRYGLIVDVMLDSLDSDGDGVPDVTDNCPSWFNLDQSLPTWPIPEDDPDCDGFTDAAESFVGTNPSVQCGPGAWPVDLDDDEDAGIFDVLTFRPYFNSPGSNPYSVRHDLDNDADVNIFDILKIKPFFNKSCT